jgi:oxygen-dependent protoporphyrinogen oxidase
MGLDLEITLFEREQRLGGKILTERLDGFVIEGGPDTFVSTKPWAVELCRQLGIDDRLQGMDMARRKVYVLNDGRLVELPDGLAMMVPTRIWPMLKTPLLSPYAKLRMGLDLVKGPRADDGDESLGDFITRRLGRQVYQRLVEPLMSGIYAGDGDHLSLQATFPFLHDWEQRYGSLTLGALALRRKRASSVSSANGRRSIFLTPRMGLAEMVEALEVELADVHIRLNSQVRSLRPAQRGFRLQTGSGQTFEADAVILATPAFAASEALSLIDQELARLLNEIEYVSTATVSLAYRQQDLPRPLDGHGYVIPRVEGRQALACTWTSSKFPYRAPEGRDLLRVFIGRAGQGEELVSDEAGLVRVARQELDETLGIHQEPLFTRSYSWPRAMPQYNLGHPARLERIGSRLRTLPGLFLAGAAYEGIGIPDCIRSGWDAADSAIAFLQARRA